VVERTHGVTASFIKELLRRATLEAVLERDGAVESVTGEHVSAALDDLLDAAQGVTRALLGVREDGASEPPRSRARSDRGHGHVEWMQSAYAGDFTVWTDDPS
jgi:hypothetical protein